MAVPKPSTAQTHEASSDSDVNRLHPWNYLLNGFPGLEGAVTLFRKLSAFDGLGTDADLIQQAAVACTQVAEVGWKTLHRVDWEKAWQPPGADAVNSLLNHLLKHAWMVDLFIGVIWNPNEDLLLKDYLRFLRREVCYPYNKETKNEWFTTEITRQEEVDGKNINKNYEVKVLNSTNKNWNELSEEEESYLGLECKPGYWYHGTSLASAVNILNEGIQLRKSRPRQDFSNSCGFYTSPKFTCAKKWAHVKTEHETRERAAVIIFSVGKQLECKNFEGLDLTGSSSRVGDWEAVVKFNRCGNQRWVPLSGELWKKFKKSDYIIGPMNGEPPPKRPFSEKACKDWLPQISSRLPNQLCIRTEKMAKLFGSLEDKHIEAVVFYGD